MRFMSVPKSTSKQCVSRLTAVLLHGEVYLCTVASAIAIEPIIAFNVTNPQFGAQSALLAWWREIIMQEKQKFLEHCSPAPTSADNLSLIAQDARHI
jgi:hypothetical protein